MCSIPCGRFVWLSKLQLKQATIEFPKNQSAEIEISGAQGLSAIWGCACIFRRGCQDHATVCLVKQELSQL